MSNATCLFSANSSRTPSFASRHIFSYTNSIPSGSVASVSKPAAQQAAAAFSARVCAAQNASLILTVALLALTAIELPPGEWLLDEVLVLALAQLIAIEFFLSIEKISDANLCAERRASSDTSPSAKASSLLPRFHCSIDVSRKTADAFSSTPTRTPRCVACICDCVWYLAGGVNGPCSPGKPRARPPNVAAGPSLGLGDIRERGDEPREEGRNEEGRIEPGDETKT